VPASSPDVRHYVRDAVLRSEERVLTSRAGTTATRPVAAWMSSIDWWLAVLMMYGDLTFADAHVVAISPSGKSKGKWTRGGEW